LFAAGVTALTYPDFFLGPWPHLDPVIAAWHRQIGELQPLAPFSAHGLAAFLAQMTAPVLSLPLIIQRLRRGPDADRPLMLLSLLGFVLFGGLALAQMRWSGEVQAVTLLPWTLTTIAIMDSKIRLGRVPLRSFALGGALLVQVLPTMATSRPGPESFTTHPASPCNWSAAARVLSQSVPGNAIVMAPVWGGPYEIPPALKDTAAFLEGSEAAAREVATRRGISHVLVCGRDHEPGFGGELAVGKHPAWLMPVPLTNGPAEFWLYRVVR
jgi:hypothetical protein